jgi:tyrosyl-tRNA synthetase
MTAYKSDLLRQLDASGYIHQTTDAAALDALASKEIVPGYIGFDATAPSLHVGNLVSIMLLRRLQQAGHKPVVVMGGGTTRIGDPTGKDEVRKMLTDETIEANISSIRKAFEQFLTFGDGPTDAVMVNNHDWLGKLGYIELLQEVGTHFTVNRMLTFDSVKLRLEREQPMTFLEFNYMILQGYDFRHLSKTMGVRLQMGGSDQWGNIINGMELARRMDGAEVFGLTTPLITKADGSKMGKSVSGAVWLNREQLPDYDYWQFWRNSDDRDVGKFLRLFTDLPLDEIERLESLEGSEINIAKIALANAATELCRGAEASALAAETARKTFEEGTSGDDLPTIDASVGGVASGARADASLWRTHGSGPVRRGGGGARHLA